MEWKPVRPKNWSRQVAEFDNFIDWAIYPNDREEIENWT